MFEQQQQQIHAHVRFHHLGNSALHETFVMVVTCECDTVANAVEGLMKWMREYDTNGNHELVDMTTHQEMRLVPANAFANQPAQMMPGAVCVARFR